MFKNTTHNNVKTHVKKCLYLRDMIDQENGKSYCKSRQLKTLNAVIEVWLTYKLDKSEWDNSIFSLTLYKKKFVFQYQRHTLRYGY